MSKEKRKSVFNIAVIGLAGTEQIKGTSGVGKSCLCNRFVREEADAYYPDHTSVLSQSDFGGRVVNNDHFLYWGEVTKQDDNGLDYKFNIIEQTEFIDDQSYQPHRSSSNQLYCKRCAQTKISSAEKLMYICTDQVGVESEFESKLMPDGKITIDGFILCYDVSLVTNRTIDDQVRFVQNCHHYLAKTKKPVLLALTKCDEGVPAFIQEGVKFAASVGGKRSSGLSVVETSASENINVTLAFLILAQLIDKTRSKSLKIISFEEAAQERKAFLKDAKEQLESLLESMVSDYHESWTNTRKNLEDKTAYLHYVDLEGKNAASKIFRKHVNYLRDEYRLNLQCEFLRFLPRALKIILPDLSRVRQTWNETLQAMAQTAEYNNWIITLDYTASVSNDETTPWYEHPHISSMDDRRIPYELLLTVDAERHFLFHRQDLEAKQRKSETKLNFREMLTQSGQVTPGREWGDVVKFFKDDSVSELSETELSTIYEQHQVEIVEKAKEDFQELLYEKSEIFVSSRNATHMELHDALKSDPRYVSMALLQKEKEEILTRHITEALYPPTDNWGAKCLAEALKSQRARLSQELPNNKLSSPSLRWQLKPDSETLNVVLLGANGLSRELANEITVHSSDEYTLDGCIHQLRLRSVDGDVTLPVNSFETSSFSPHGCIAVYSSIESLNYIETSLEKTVVTSNESPDSPLPPFQGLPVSILLASYSTSQKEVHKLRDAGERLASRIGCPFIDVLAPEYNYNRRFHESQIKLAMKSLIKGINERAGSGRNSFIDPDQPAENERGPGPADLRIVMCTRKDDFKTAEVALSPLLNHTSFCDPGPPEGDEEETEDTVVVETYLGTQRRRISVTLTSYQCARNILSSGNPVHGFILVYDTVLKSSFSILKVFATNTASSYPLLLLCVSPNDDRPAAAAFFKQDNTARQLVVDGNTLADKLRAKFVSASSRHRRQTEVYSTFFRDAWDHIEDTEAIHRINRVVVEEDAKSDDATDSRGPTPTPTPRTSLNNKMPEKKSGSTEQLATKYDIPRIDRASITPPSTLRFNISSQSSYSEPGLSDAGHTTPASTWSTGSDEYRPDTPSTSPTAGLLDNEEREYFDNSKPPAQTSHLYPSAGHVPGKLNPDLISKVAAVIRKPGGHLPDVFQRHPTDPPYMQVQPPSSTDPSRAGAIRVLPLQNDLPERPSAITVTTANGMKVLHEQRTTPLFRGSATVREGSGSRHRPGPHRNGKRLPLKSVDIDSTPTSSHTPPTLRSMRHSTADLLSGPGVGKSDVDGAFLTKKAFTSSQEDLLHPSSTVPAMFTIGADRTPKEGRFNKKNKDEDGKRKEKKEKNKDKEQKNKTKDVKTKHPRPMTIATGNKHTLSDYFNKPLDNIVQSLNHMVPLFPERCVRFIEDNGIQTEGLYRIPANAKEREMIIKKFDEDNSYDLQSSDASVHTVAGCLTWFFSHKNLPESLIPSNLHDDFEDAIHMPDQSLRNMAVRGVVRKLPYSNYSTFKFICTHLKKVSDYSAENKMTADNLAICWGNTLFRPELDPYSNGVPMKTCFKDVLTTCIVQCGFIFYGQQEV
ncbi:unnamed protein product [Clavelina lepadiformis]|uniref:Rho GTPase-activating protein 5 n=1 Tax=Clavelina lepadiformis TaxID=159417 RepID=A0ABP0GNI3_CLALP